MESELKSNVTGMGIGMMKFGKSESELESQSHDVIGINIFGEHRNRNQNHLLHESESENPGIRIGISITGIRILSGIKGAGIIYNSDAYSRCCHYSTGVHCSNTAPKADLLKFNKINNTFL